MWSTNKRHSLLNNIENTEWDLIIIGGGITGAGIFSEASRSGLRVLLVEQKDFCWGTSSRSSKMIHGGLRYLLQGNVLLTLRAAREREFLLKKYAGLVKPLPFLLPLFKNTKPSKWLARLGITFYELLVGRWNHNYWNPKRLISQIPSIKSENLEGALYFVEATTDDVRLVLRLLHEGTNDKCYPLNYMKAVSLIQENNQVSGIFLEDNKKQYSVKSKLVINATGIWADHLRSQIGAQPRMRPQRGSHIVFPKTKLPLDYCVYFVHPQDQRLMFAYPWEEEILIGTTDLDNGHDINLEPHITENEVQYLMEGINYMFPQLNLEAEDALSTYSGMRPIIGSGKASPSDESRDHAIWLEHGLMTVTGGKYTTFRIVAKETLKKAMEVIQPFTIVSDNISEKFSLNPSVGLPTETQQRMFGFYGEDLKTMLNSFDERDKEKIEGTPLIWGEVRWSAKNEAIEHLDDLLLRRTRLGLLLPEGAECHKERIEQLVKQELNWDQDKWDEEWNNYKSIIETSYSKSAILQSA